MIARKGQPPPMRAFFQPGEQRRFIEKAVAATGCQTLKDAAPHLRIPYFRLRDWRLERTHIKMEVVEDWCRRFGLPMPEILEVRDENWRFAYGGRRCVELHGPPGTLDTRSLGGKRSAELQRQRGRIGVRRQDPVRLKELAAKIKELHWERGLSQRELLRTLRLSSVALRKIAQTFNIRLRPYREALELAKTQGKFNGRPHSQETRLMLKQKMHERYASGWVATGGRCIKIHHFSPCAGKVTLDGTWELLVAQLLDKAGIRWQRNRRGFRYVGRDGNGHRYFPDFYLPDHDLFIEVKGYIDDDAKHKLDTFMRRYPGRLVVLHGKKLFAALRRGDVTLPELLVHDSPSTSARWHSEVIGPLRTAKRSGNLEKMS